MLTLYISSMGMATGRLDLPMPLDEIKRQMELIRVKEQSDRAVLIYDTECPIPTLRYHLQSIKLDNDSTLQKLNQLAEAINGMNTAGHHQLYKALPTDVRLSLDDVLRNAACIKPASMDSYEIIPEITTHQALGKWLVEHDRLEERVPESLQPYLDYRSIGVDYCIEHDGVFLTNGYTGIRIGAMEQVPEESRAMLLTLATSSRSYPLVLPASEERLEQAKRALGVDDLSPAVIASVDYVAPYLEQLIPTDCITVEDANEMADCLRQIKTDGEMMKYCAVLEVEEPSTFTEALDMAIDLDDYELILDNEREYGQEALRRLGADGELLDTIEGYTDFDALGRAMMEEDGVRQTGYGLVRRLSKPFPKPEIGQIMM